MESETVQPMKQRKSGRPLKTDEPLKTYSFSLSENQIALLDGWAKAKGESRSAVLRSLVMRLEAAPVVEPKPLQLNPVDVQPVADAPRPPSDIAVEAAVAAVEYDAAVEPPVELTVAQRIAAALASLDA
jgi:hypothetical protein